MDARSLRHLYVTMVNRHHTLESYEPNLKYGHRKLVRILQSKPPLKICRKWELKFSTSENEQDDLKITVEYFFESLRSYVMSEEEAEKALLQEKFKVHESTKKREVIKKRSEAKDNPEDHLY